MLNFNLSKEDRSVTRKVAPSTVITAEGLALVVDNSVANGVKPSEGVAGEIFAGVSISQQTTLEVMPKIEEKVVGNDDKITLSRTPLAGTIRILNLDTDTVQTAGDPSTTDNTYSLSGAVLSFHANRTGNLMRIAYRYNPTVVEAKATQGDVFPGGPADALLDTVGVLVAGDVYTSEFDTSADWTADPVVVKLGANGLFTVGGGGVTLTTVRVLEVPTADQPWLGLSINNG